MKKSIFLTAILCIFALAITGCANSKLANQLNNKYAQDTPTEIIPDEVQKLLETANTLTNPDAKYVEWLYNVKAFAQTENVSELESHTDTAINFSNIEYRMQEYKDKIVGFLNAKYINPVTGSVTEQIETLLAKTDTLTNPDAKYVEWLYNVKAFAQTENL